MRIDQGFHKAKLQEMRDRFTARVRGHFHLKEDHLDVGRRFFNLLADKGILNGKVVLDFARDAAAAAANYGINLRGLDISFIAQYPKWDDEENAEKWLAQQMSDLIRNVVLVISLPDGREIEVPAFPGVRGEDGVFRRFSQEDAAIQAASGNPLPQEFIMWQALEELESFIDKHLAIEQLQGLCADLQGVIARHRSHAPRPRSK